MKKQTKKKLEVGRQTLRNLQQKQLDTVAGGMIPPTGPSRCGDDCPPSVGNNNCW